MRLSRIEMFGFKSFMSKAELHFEPGITAILGPNGCGKSNIVDAVRWVLGEQSAKLLRGAKMENVIFDGTKKRAPMGFAEVAMTFTGASERLPVEWDEITIKRRVTRDGGSEYSLNNQPYRLHEIRDLLSGTGLSNHAYAIIERDMVEAVLSPNGDKRRLLFEEASGIMKYKLRRKESLSKLASTENDLTRLADILEELGKTVRSLKYQMGRARSYQRLREELREAERYEAAERLHACWQQDRELASRLGGLGDANLAEESRQASMEERIAGMRAELLTREGEHQGARDRLEQELTDYRKSEEALAVLEEKARAQTREAERLDQEERLAQAALDGLEGEETQLAEEIRELSERREQLSAERADCSRILAEIETSFQDRRVVLQREKQLQLDFARHRAETGGEAERLRERLAQSESRREELEDEDQVIARRGEDLTAEIESLRSVRDSGEQAQRELDEERERELESYRLLEGEVERHGRLVQDRLVEREKLDTRLELLRGLEETGAGQTAGTRWLLESKAGEPSLQGSLTELIHVEPEHRRAVETALDQVLGALVLSDSGRGLAWLDELAEAGAGRAMMFLLGKQTAGDAVGPSPHEDLIPMASLIRAEAPLYGALERLLGHCYLAPERQSAAKLSAEADRDLTLVCADGTLFRGGFLMVGGSAQDAELGSLGRREEMARLEQRVEQLDEQLAELREQQERCVKERVAKGEALAALEERLTAAREAHSQSEMTLARGEARLHRLKEEHEDLAAERKRWQQLRSSLDEALTDAEQRLVSLDVEAPREDLDLGELEREVGGLEKSREEQQARVAEKQLEITAAGGRAEALSLRRENLERTREREDQRRRQSREGAAACRTEIESLGEQSRELRETLRGRQSQLEAQRSAAQVILDAIVALREQEEGLQAELRGLRDKQREQEQLRHQVEMERNTLAVKMEGIAQRLREEYDLVVDPQLDPAAGEGYEPTEGRSAAEAIQTLRTKIDRLGAVNLMALEEYEEKNERYEFLHEQKGDLIRARDGLMETIQRINQEARQRFSENFRVVRKNFVDIFTTLFEGGEADLNYTTGDDPLQAEITITAKPKEKNLSSVQLLSTGEKTLTALALLFAIYLSRPSPFCVFDEVDAPLDDANVTRFLRLIREFSQRTQFLLITHNKKTMEAARHLYGVTMEESGVSKIVSVAFDEIPADLEAGAAAGSTS